MSIQTFQSKLSSESSVLFEALRRLNRIEDLSKLQTLKRKLATWDSWP